MIFLILPLLLLSAPSAFACSDLFLSEENSTQLKTLQGELRKEPRESEIETLKTKIQSFCKENSSYRSVSNQLKLQRRPLLETKAYWLRSSQEGTSEVLHSVSVNPNTVETIEYLENSEISGKALQDVCSRNEEVILDENYIRKQMIKFRDQDHHFLLATLPESKKTVGFMLVRFSQDSAENELIYKSHIELICTSESLKGLGKVFLSYAATDLTHNQPVDVISLESTREAIPFYESQGFLQFFEGRKGLPGVSRYFGKVTNSGIRKMSSDLDLHLETLSPISKTKAIFSWLRKLLVNDEENQDPLLENQVIFRKVFLCSETKVSSETVQDFRNLVQLVAESCPFDKTKYNFISELLETSEKLNDPQLQSSIQVLISKCFPETEVSRLISEVQIDEIPSLRSLYRALLFRLPRYLSLYSKFFEAVKALSFDGTWDLEYSKLVEIAQQVTQSPLTPNNKDIFEIALTEKSAVWTSPRNQAHTSIRKLFVSRLPRFELCFLGQMVLKVPQDFLSEVNFLVQYCDLETIPLLDLALASEQPISNRSKVVGILKNEFQKSLQLQTPTDADWMHYASALSIVSNNPEWQGEVDQFRQRVNQLLTEGMQSEESAVATWYLTQTFALELTRSWREELMLLLGRNRLELKEITRAAYFRDLENDPLRSQLYAIAQIKDADLRRSKLQELKNPAVAAVPALSPKRSLDDAFDPFSFVNLEQYDQETGSSTEDEVRSPKALRAGPKDE
jgi:hypothetical protein